jgi:hypothetical protein
MLTPGVGVANKHAARWTLRATNQVSCDSGPLAIAFVTAQAGQGIRRAEGDHGASVPALSRG